MKMSNIIGGVASSAVILAMAFIYQTAEKASAAESPANTVYINRIVEVERVVKVEVEVERIVYVQPRVKAKPIFADISDEQRRCLALNIYFEARGESQLGQEFVGWVTLNRVRDHRFPSTVCRVVYQSSQFSWTHDGKSDKPRNNAAWATAQAIAASVIESYGVDLDPTEGSLYFHADYVKPYWAAEFNRVVRVDNHVFYNRS